MLAHLILFPSCPERKNVSVSLSENDWIAMIISNLPEQGIQCQNIFWYLDVGSSGKSCLLFPHPRWRLGVAKSHSPATEVAGKGREQQSHAVT